MHFLLSYYWQASFFLNAYCSCCSFFCIHSFSPPSLTTESSGIFSGAKEKRREVEKQQRKCENAIHEYLPLLISSARRRWMVASAAAASSSSELLLLLVSFRRLQRAVAGGGVGTQKWSRMNIRTNERTNEWNARKQGYFGSQQVANRKLGFLICRWLFFRL